MVHGPHAHRFLEIVFIEKGRGAHIVEGKRVPVGPGDVFALAPGQAHDPDGLDSTIHWVLAFELRFLFAGRDERELFVSCPDEVVLLCFLRRPDDGVHLRLSRENARAWVSWLERLEKELERRELGYASAAKGLVELMLVDLARMVEPYIPHVASKQRPQLARVSPAGVPGWKTIPSFYQVSTNDEAIDPKLQRFFARRMGAHTIEIAASHVSLVSRSGAVAELIERAAGRQ